MEQSQTLNNDVYYLNLPVKELFTRFYDIVVVVIVVTVVIDFFFFLVRTVFALYLSCPSFLFGVVNLSKLINKSTENRAS